MPDPDATTVVTTPPAEGEPTGGKPTSTAPAEGEPKTTPSEPTTPAEGEPKAPITTIAGGGQGAAGNDTPEVYGNITLPDGWTMNDGLLEAMTPALRKGKMSDEDVQTLVDGWIAHETGRAAKEVADFEAQQTEWVETIKASPDFGGANFDKTSERSALTVATFGSPALVEELNRTGRGNDPEFVFFTARIGALLEEHDLHLPQDAAGAGVTKEELSLADKMYEKDGSPLKEK